MNTLLASEMKMDVPEVLSFVDTETSGLNVDKDRLLEVACLRYHVPTASVIDARSWIFHSEVNPAESINGISTDLLQKYGLRTDAERKKAATELAEMMRSSHAILAWNAQFDRRWIERLFRQTQVFVDEGDTLSVPWVCAMQDMKWPKPSSSRSLSAVALAHEVGLVDAHRALPDIWTMARLFRRASELGTDISFQVLHGLRPKATYEALVTYADRHLAKNAGFRWDEASKKWMRTMARQDASALPFAVREVIEAGSSWHQTHQGLRVYVAASSDYTNANFVKKVLDQISPRSIFCSSDINPTIFSALLSVGIDRDISLHGKEDRPSQAHELVLVFGTDDDADNQASLARESQIELVRPVMDLAP